MDYKTKELAVAAAGSAKSMKGAEPEIVRRIYSVTHARAQPEEAKNAELENLRKQHEMLSSRSASSGKFMHESSNNLAEEAECETKNPEDELDAARKKAVDLLSQLQESLAMHVRALINTRSDWSRRLLCSSRQFCVEECL
jgi:hypothetical protein